MITDKQVKGIQGNAVLHGVIYCTEDNSFYCNGEFICTCSYDTRQSKYIAKHKHKSYLQGYKFIYGNSPEGIRIKIEKRINNIM